VLEVRSNITTRQKLKTNTRCFSRRNAEAVAERTLSLENGRKKRDEALFDRPYQTLANDAARLYLQSAAQQLSGVASAKARKDEGSDSICKRHIKSLNPKRRHTLQRSPSAHRDNRETARHADVASAVTALHLPRKASARCTSYRRRCLVRWTA
jgi:hypothetical protein